MKVLKKNRIQVSFDDETMEILEVLSLKKKKSLSDIVRTMVEDWLEKYEDRFWGEIAKRESSHHTLPHSEVWDGI